jgi:hypothetical protein
VNKCFPDEENPQDEVKCDILLDEELDSVNPNSSLEVDVPESPQTSHL